MFELAHQRIITWPVTLTQEQNGELAEVTIRVQYEVLTRSELKTIDRQQRATLIDQLFGLLRRQAAPGGGTDADGVRAQIADMEAAIDTADRDQAALLLTRIKGWSGVVNAGKAVEYTPEIGAGVMEYEPAFQAFWGGLLDASRSAKPKNSSPGPAGTLAPVQS